MLGGVASGKNEGEGAMKSTGIRQLIIKITTHMTEKRQKAAQSNREFLDFWQTRYGA